MITTTHRNRFSFLAWTIDAGVARCSEGGCATLRLDLDDDGRRELGAPAAAVALELTIDARSVTAWRTLDEGGSIVDAGEGRPQQRSAR